MNRIKKTMLLMLSGILVAAAGCNEYAKKKQVIAAKWEQSVAKEKLSLAESYIENGNIAQAKETLERCLDSVPNEARVYLLMGRIQFIEERTQEAKTSFEKAVAIDEQLDKGWYYLGSLAVLRGDLAQAAECYQKAQNLDPDEIEYRISLSEVLAESEKIDEAEALIRKGLEYDSHNIELLLILAQLKQQAGKPHEAVSIYEQAQLFHGAQPRITEPCAYGYIALAKWHEAYQKFELLIPYLEDGSEPYYTTMRAAALCAYNSGQYSVSLKYYDKLSVVYRDEAGIWLSMAQSALGAEDAGKAAVYAQKAMKLRPAWPAAFAVLGGAQYLQGEYENAILSFNNIIDDDEFGSYGWLMTGRCHQKLGQITQANLAFERLVKKQGKGVLPVQ